MWKYRTEQETNMISTYKSNSCGAKVIWGSMKIIYSFTITLNGVDVGRGNHSLWKTFFLFIIGFIQAMKYRMEQIPI